MIMRYRPVLLFALGLVAALSCTSTASAAANYTALTLPTLNTNIGTWTDGGVYETVFPGSHTWNGVPFELSEDASGNKVYWSATSATLDIPVGIFGVTDAYTIINSAYGAYGYTVGSVEFFGSDTAYQKVDLTEGVNVRDHYNDGYNNVIDGTHAMLAWDPDGVGSRLDMQIYHLSPDFADETLTTIRFTTNGSGANGQPFIGAATVATIPEPENYAMLLAGLGLIAWSLRRHTSRAE